MGEHRITLTPAYRVTDKGEGRGHGRATMHYGDELLGDSAMPLLDGARWLLNNGRAEPDDTITTYRDGVPCLRAKVGVAAGLTAAERDRGGGPRFERWHPPPSFK